MQTTNKGDGTLGYLQRLPHQLIFRSFHWSKTYLECHSLNLSGGVWLMVLLLLPSPVFGQRVPLTFL
jgi:hypothetical protein